MRFGVRVQTGGCPDIVLSTEDARGERMTKSGLIEEVRDLHERGISWEKLHFLGLEYRFVSEFLQGKIRNRVL